MARTDLEQLVYEMDVNISKLIKNQEKAIAAANGGATAIEKRYQRMAANANQSFGRMDVAKAVDKVWDNSRIRLFDSAAARIGITGKALEALGPAGIAGAVGVVAVAAAFKEAHDAAKFADDLQDTAERLHTTTDLLQEYRYATRAAGGEEKGADEALEAFSETLGKAQEGLKKGQRAFLALGFTKEQILSFRTAEEALTAVIQRISELKSDPQKDAIIQQLGLTGMKPLILQGVAAMQELKAEAKRLGFVMDSDLVARGAEINKEFELTSKIIDVQLKSAFIDLAPVLLKLLKFAADFATHIADAADAMRSIENRTHAGLERQRNSILNDIGDLSNGRGPVPGFLRGIYLQKRFEQLDAVNKALTAQGSAALPPSRSSGGTRSLVPQGGGGAKHGPADQSQQTLDRLIEEQMGAAKALVENMLQWVQTYDPQNLGQIDDLIDQQAAAERDALAAAKKKALDQVAAQAKAGTLRGEAVKQAQTAIEQTYADKELLLARKMQEEHAKASVAAEKSWLDHAEEIQSIYDSIASNASAMATSSKQRREIELHNLELDQRLEQIKIDQLRAADPLADTTNKSKWDELQAAINDRRVSDRQAVEDRNLGPIERYRKELSNLDDQFETMAVEGVKNLSDGLADAIINAKNLGEVAGNVFRQLLAQILSASLQKFAFAPILGALGLPHFAGGTDFAPGGLAVVNERGGEIINLPRGSQVIPHDLSRALLAQRSSASAGTNVYVSIAANDAVMASEIYARIDAGLHKAMNYTNHVARYNFQLQRSEAARAAGNRLG